MALFNGGLKIRLWDGNGNSQSSFQAHRNRIWKLAFSPDGSLLASAGDDGTVKLWQLDGTLVATPVTQKAPGWGVAFSPDGTTLAVASMDDILHLWDVETSTAQQIPGQSQGLTRVAFSPDGHTIATGGIDTTVKLWNRDGTLQNTLPGHRSQITSLTFSPVCPADRLCQRGASPEGNGRYLYSGSDDTQLIAWDLDQIATLNPLDSACNWISDYLKTNERVAPEDVSLCDNNN